MTEAKTCHACSAAAKYRCPRCDTPSCSLNCIRQHKSTTSCSGQRDPAAYVPAKDYGYQQLMSDYTYLEDVSRKVGLASRERAQQHIAAPPPSNLTQRRAKIPMWAHEAGRQGLKVLLLGDGMQRRKENKSTFAAASKTLHLSITFQLHSATEGVVIAFTTHANPANASLAELIKKPLVDGRAAKQAPSKDTLKAWKDSFDAVRYFMRLQDDPRRSDFEYEPPQSPQPQPREEERQVVAGERKLHPSLPSKPAFAMPSVSQPTTSSAGHSGSMSSTAAPTTMLPPALPPVTSLSAPAVPVKRPAEDKQPQVKEEEPKKKKKQRMQRTVYAELDSHASLLSQLQGRQFIEWPVIECFISAEPQAADEVQPVLPASSEGKVQVQKAVKVVGGVQMAQDYGSSGDEEEEKEEEEQAEEVQGMLLPKHEQGT